MNAMTFTDQFTKVSDVVKIPPNFDVLADSSAEESLRKTSRVIKKYSTKYLGELAAVGIRDIFIRAQSETTAWRDPSLAALTPLLIPAVGMPLVGFAASFGIDYAVFGGAAKDLPLSFLFGFGSVVFGTSMGYVDKKWKGVVLSGLIVASSVAAFVGADDSKYRAHITTPLYAAFGKSSAGTQTAADMAKSDYDAAGLHKQADHDEFTLHDAKKQGTNEPMNMLNDGNPYNDVRGYELQDKILPADQRDVDAKLVIWKNAQAKVPAAEARDPIELAGRGVVAASLAAWLIVSQIFVASVVEKMPGRFEHFSQKAMIRREQRKFLKDMQEPDPILRKNKIAAAIKDMLVKRFAVVLSEAAMGDPERLANVEMLFGQQSLDDMVRIGVDTVYKANGSNTLSSDAPSATPSLTTAQGETLPITDPDIAGHTPLFDAQPFADMVHTGVDTVDKSIDPEKTATATAPPADADSVAPPEAPASKASPDSKPEPLTVDRFVEERLAGKDQQDPAHMQFYVNNAGEIEDEIRKRAVELARATDNSGASDAKAAPEADGHRTRDGESGPKSKAGTIAQTSPEVDQASPASQAAPIEQPVESGDVDGASAETIQIPSRPGGRGWRIEIISDPDNNLKMTHDLKTPDGSGTSAPAPGA